MIKTVELIVAIFLMIFCFFAGVKYSDGVKSHASWLFESKEEEVELPDLSSEVEIEISNPGEAGAANQDGLNSNQQVQPAPGNPSNYIDDSDHQE